MMKISIIVLLFAIATCVIANEGVFKEGVFFEGEAISNPLNEKSQSPNLSIQDQLIQGFQSCPNNVQCPIYSHRCCCGIQNGATVCMANAFQQWLCFDPSETQCCNYVPGKSYLLVCNTGYKCVSDPGTLSGNTCNKKGLSGGAVAGIIISILVVVGIIVGVVYCMKRRQTSYQAIKY